MMIRLVTSDTCARCGAEIDGGTVCEACAAAIDAEARGTVELRLERAGVPRRYREAALETAADGRPGLREVVDRLAAWRGDPWAVVILGPAGTGKTWLAAALVRAWIEAGRYARFVPALDWLSRCQAALSTGDAEQEYAAVAGYRGLLVLDDLAAQGVGEWQQMLAVRLVDRRWRDGLPTVVTTNDTSHELRARYGQRLVDRLAAGLVVRLRGESWRVAAGERIETGGDQ